MVNCSTPTTTTTTTPARQKSAIVEKSLDLYLHKKYIRESLKYGALNALLLSILLYDITSKCPYNFSNWYYLEYAFCVITGLSLFYNLSRVLYYKISCKPVGGTLEQSRLLKFPENDGSFVVTPTKAKSPTTSKTPTNITALSWSHSSFNDCTYILNILNLVLI